VNVAVIFGVGVMPNDEGGGRAVSVAGPAVSFGVGDETGDESGVNARVEVIVGEAATRLVGAG
jgi:hypothetical protein